MLLLAKQPEFMAYLLWVGIAIGAVVVATLAIVWYRRRILGPTQVDHQGGLLDELRQMRNRGEISEEEFNATKRAMAERAAGKPRTRTKPEPRAMSDSKVAPPGFDLTGQPLPRPQNDADSPPQV